MTALIGSAGPLAVTEPVLMEVLAGATQRPARERSSATPVALRIACFRRGRRFRSGSNIYRRCRGVGVTPRGIVDCMIAAVARRRGATLLAFDVDLDRVAGVVGIGMDEASLRA